MMYLTEQVFLNLPLPVITEIISYLEQAEVANVAVTCSQLYLVAISVLYHSIQIFPLDPAPEEEFGDLYSQRGCQSRNSKTHGRLKNFPVYKGSQITTIEKIAALSETLLTKPEIAERIHYLDFHGGFGDELVQYFKRDIEEHMESHAINLKRLRIVYESGEMSELNSVGSKPLKNTSHVKVDQLHQLSKLQHIRLDSIAFEVDQPDLSSFDLFADELEYVYRVPKLSFSTLQGCGLEVLKAMHCGLVKLEPSVLTLEHRHEASEHEEIRGTGDGGEQSLVEQLNRAAIHGDVPKLDFHILDERIHLSNLSILHLRVSCAEHDVDFIEAGCCCFVNFLTSWRQFLSANEGLPNLRELELSVPPPRDWLRPHDLLDVIVTPASDFIKTLTGLRKLTFGLSTQTFKMYAETGMSPALLNRINTRLIEAFFLSLGGVSSTLEHLELPDFLMAFFFYKPHFMELLLHTCQCCGCGMVLQEFERHFIEVEEWDDDEGNEIGIYNGNESDDHDAVGNENENYDGNENGNEFNEIDSNDTVRATYEHDNYTQTGNREVQNDANDTHFDENDENEVNISALNKSAFFLMIGLVLDKLQNERKLLAPLNRKTGLNECHLFRGQPNTLAEIAAISGQENSHNWDLLVSIYILHQIRPVLQFFKKHFPKLSLVMVHGIYYEKGQDGNFHSVFDSDEYPRLLFLNGFKVTSEKYGHYVFD